MTTVVLDVIWWIIKRIFIGLFYVVIAPFFFIYFIVKKCRGE
jgi:hypothetical protein